MSDSNRVSFPPVKKGAADDDDGSLQAKEPWIPKNWNMFKKKEYELRKMAPQQKSRYLAYEDPPKNVSEAQAVTKKRLLDQRKEFRRNNKPPTEEELREVDVQSKLIGQLKAAEARNRIVLTRKRYVANREQECKHLISCQPTARKAVRLQAILPVGEQQRKKKRSESAKIDKQIGARVDSLLEDNLNLLTARN